MEPTQSYVHCVTVTLRHLDQEADHTPPYYAEVTSPHTISQLAHGNPYLLINFYHLEINVLGGLDHSTLKHKQVLGLFSLISTLTLFLWHCATSRNFAGSIPDCVIGIFLWHNPTARNMVLVSTQPLTQMSIRNVYWVVKAAGAWIWQPCHLHVPMKSGILNLLEVSGSVEACNGFALTLLSFYTRFLYNIF
jgi:hypothetical protein